MKPERANYYAIAATCLLVILTGVLVTLGFVFDCYARAETSDILTEVESANILEE